MSNMLSYDLTGMEQSRETLMGAVAVARAVKETLTGMRLPSDASFSFQSEIEMLQKCNTMFNNVSTEISNAVYDILIAEGNNVEIANQYLISVGRINDVVINLCVDDMTNQFAENFDFLKDFLENPTDGFSDSSMMTSETMLEMASNWCTANNYGLRVNENGKNVFFNEDGEEFSIWDIYNQIDEKLSSNNVYKDGQTTIRDIAKILEQKGNEEFFCDWLLTNAKVASSPSLEVQIGASGVNLVATATEVGLSTVEVLERTGAVFFGAGASIFTGVTDLITWLGEKMGSGAKGTTYTEDMWKNIMKGSSKNQTKEIMDAIYATDFMQEIDKNAFEALKRDGIATQIAEGVFQVGAVVLITTATGGAVPAYTIQGAKTFGEGFGNVLNQAEAKAEGDEWITVDNLLKAIGYGGSRASWEMLEWIAGQKITGANITGNKYLDTAIRLTTNATYNGADVLAYSAMDASLYGEDYEKAFKDNGGWMAVGASVAIGLLSNLPEEIRFLKNTDADEYFRNNHTIINDGIGQRGTNKTTTKKDEMEQEGESNPTIEDDGLSKEYEEYLEAERDYWDDLEWDGESREIYGSLVDEFNVFLDLRGEIDERKFLAILDYLGDEKYIVINDSGSQEYYEKLRSIIKNANDDVNITSMMDRSGVSKEKFFLAEERADVILAGMNPKWNQEQKMAYIHSRMGGNVGYVADYDFQDLDYLMKDNVPKDIAMMTDEMFEILDQKSRYSQDAWGTLGNGEGVCAGLARTESNLFNRCGINSTTVESMGGTHLMVDVTLDDGSHMYLDPTWDLSRTAIGYTPKYFAFDPSPEKKLEPPKVLEGTKVKIYNAEDTKELFSDVGYNTNVDGDGIFIQQSTSLASREDLTYSEKLEQIMSNIPEEALEHQNATFDAVAMGVGAANFGKGTVSAGYLYKKDDVLFEKPVLLVHLNDDPIAYIYDENSKNMIKINPEDVVSGYNKHCTKTTSMIDDMIELVEGK